MQVYIVQQIKEKRIAVDCGPNLTVEYTDLRGAFATEDLAKQWIKNMKLSFMEVMIIPFHVVEVM